MAVMDIPPSDFTLDPVIIKTFEILGHENIGPMATGASKAVRYLLYNLNIPTWDAAYRIVMLPELAANKEYTSTLLKKRAMADVKLACWFLGNLDTEPDLTETTSRDIITSFPSPESTNYKRQIRVGDLPEFPGNDEEWPIWKEACEAQFKIDGLFDCVTDESYAILHPRENVVIHGMLTKALMKRSSYAHFPCLMDNQDVVVEPGNACVNIMNTRC